MATKYVTYIVDAECENTETGKTHHRNINQFDVPKGKGQKYVDAGVKRIVDERRSQGKAGPLHLRVYTGIAPNGKIEFDGNGRVVGTKLTDEAKRLTNEDYMCIEDAADREAASLRVMKRAGMI